MMQPDWTKTKTLVQGDTIVTDDPRLVASTVLGSCVSICLFDPAVRVGGINHYLLAENSEDQKNTAKYGLFAFEVLLNELLKNGAKRHSIQAKVFGGASMAGKFHALGPKNAEFAKSVLRQEGIEYVGGDTGGTCARRLKFHPVTGSARMALIPALAAPQETPQSVARVGTTAAELF